MTKQQERVLEASLKAFWGGEGVGVHWSVGWRGEGKGKEKEKEKEGWLRLEDNRVSRHVIKQSSHDQRDGLD